MQAHQYRGYPQQGPVARPPPPGHHGVPQPNRGRVPMGTMVPPGQHHPMQGNAPPMPPQMVPQQHAPTYLHDLPKRKARRPNDKNLPPGMEEVVVDGGQIVKNFERLRDFERRLDATMTRKRVDTFDSLSRPIKTTRIMRIWITNTVEDQAWQSTGVNIDSFDFSSNSEASYRVKIEGRLLDDEEEEETNATSEGKDQAQESEDSDKMDTGDTADKAADETQKRNGKTGDRFRFSHMFKGLKVDFDPTARARLGSDVNIEWKKPERAPPSSGHPAAPLPAAADFDEFTFKRNGDENMNITINLFRDEEPEKFALSPDLANLVDMSEATRQDVVLGLWEYIKLMGLQEDEEKRNFRCDDALRKIIPRAEVGHIFLLADYITPHLRPLPPVKLPYTIRVDQDYHKDPQPTVYDVRVTVDSPLRAQMNNFYRQAGFLEMLKEVAQRDEQIVTLVNALIEHKARYDFMTALESDPVNFVRTWLSSQQRDLEIIMAEMPRGGLDTTGDEWHMGGPDSVWATSHARESVNLLLAKQPAHR